MRGAHSRSMHCLLDLDPDLADALDPGTRPAARAAAVALNFETDAGELRVPDWLVDSGSGPGVLILDGILAVNVCVGDRVAAELIGAGDVLQPTPAEHEELLSCNVTWRALVPSRFALLDGDFAKRVRFWPQVSHALLRRAARRAANLNVQRAIAAQPRLEVRLALLLWHLAARWGKVERGGIRLPLPLTHHLLGRLVGAERPSVSHALARLAHTSLITGHGDEWHLHGSLEDQLPALVQPIGAQTERLLASVAGGPAEIRSVPPPRCD
jgi:CRP/FNR family transcriptional regulator, cyclic AMP receptor protein